MISVIDIDPLHSHLTMQFSGNICKFTKPKLERCISIRDSLENHEGQFCWDWDTHDFAIQDISITGFKIIHSNLFNVYLDTAWIEPEDAHCSEGDGKHIILSSNEITDIVLCETLFPTDKYINEFMNNIRPNRQ